MDKIKILLVDYEQDFIKNFSERLKSRNLKLDHALNGEQALELVVNEEPDVIIFDLETPSFVGIELLRDVKITYPDIQVIILTSHYSIKNRIEAFLAGAYELLEKPVDIEVLTNTIRKAYKNKTTNRLKFMLKTY